MDEAAGDPGGGDGHGRGGAAAWSARGGAGSRRGGSASRDQVAGHAGAHRTLAVDGAASASLGVIACSGCQASRSSPTAMDRGRHRQPRVERRDRRVGAEGESDAVVEHPPQREASGRRGRATSARSRRGRREDARAARWRRCRGRPSGARRRGGSAGRARSNRSARVSAYDVEGLRGPPRHRWRGWPRPGRACGPAPSARAAPRRSGWRRRRRCRRRTARSTRRCGC